MPEETLTLLGGKTAPPASPDEAKLERVPNPNPGDAYLVRFTCPEFTSLCPITGQPDFAHLVIDYLPAKWLVESKSLKLYLASFRNHGAFHEACTDGIDEALDPLRFDGGPEIECLTLAEGPPGIETQRHVDGVIAPLFGLVESHDNRASAFGISCFSDPGLQSLRGTPPAPAPKPTRGALSACTPLTPPTRPSAPSQRPARKSPHSHSARRMGEG